MTGQYLREAENIDSGVRRVTIIGEKDGKNEADSEWLMFSLPVTTSDGRQVKPVEIAFSCIQEEESGPQRICRVEGSPLVVFFPTAVETHLGFLVQGPYRTTPSRDNVARDDDWNRSLVDQTASLLKFSLCWLRDHQLLDTAVLRCLPIDPSKFSDTNLFAPLFAATKEALSSENLLPCFNNGYVAASRARLGRTQGLRDLFSPTQLATLYGQKHKLFWLSGDITQDRAPELRSYLIQETKVAEIATEDLIPQLTQAFLKEQPDTWILKLYEFLNGQPALRQRVARIPLIRLENGRHVMAQANDKASAFLPTDVETQFPTVRRSVCTTEPALAFLRSLGLKEPDPVDDVIENVLPTYRKGEIDVKDAEYEADISRTLGALATDSATQRNRLIDQLKDTEFVRSVDAGDGSEGYAKPCEVYLATDRLKKLFHGVVGILLVNDSQQCLRGEKVRDLLESCGAVRHLRPIGDITLSTEERRKLREKAGHPKTSCQNDQVIDWTLKGLEKLLALLPNLDVDRQKCVPGLLWDELAHLEERRGKNLFTGNYKWTHYGSYNRSFEAAFVRRLNNTPWVPDAEGQLQRPELVLFDSLGWKENPFLKSMISFRPPIIETLAEAAGFEPGVLDLLKQRGLTNVSNLLDALGLEEDSSGSTSNDGEKTENSRAHDHRTVDREGSGSGTGAKDTAGGQHHGEGGTKKSNSREEKRPDSTGACQFVSYVATHPGEGEPDPDGLDKESRMKLEAKAIELILACESDWRPTPPNNPGYDLFKIGEDGQPISWCEVKAMKGSLQDRPVGLSHTQFSFASKHGESFWVYVVEHAGDDRAARIVRIQDPAGKARTFTFDRGWRAVST